ncbi:MAG: DUF4965 domain-containing protein [Phycisphaerales bacterium]|nr:DUF4965 domain-containing protein [Phycisphaerales bacterium]
MTAEESVPKPAPVYGKFRYVRRWKGLDEVMRSSIARRDDFLALSRRFEKIFDQAPLQAADRHLFHQSFQTYLSNTWWCDLDDGQEWFSVWEGSCYYHSTIDVEYNVALLYLCLWPKLLAMQLNQWPRVEKPHEPSQGSILSHDIGTGPRIGRQAYPHDMPVEENANYLLLLQAYSHATGDLAIAKMGSPPCSDWRSICSGPIAITPASPAKAPPTPSTMPPPPPSIPASRLTWQSNG